MNITRVACGVLWPGVRLRPAPWKRSRRWSGLVKKCARALSTSANGSASPEDNLLLSQWRHQQRPQARLMKDLRWPSEQQSSR